MYISITLLVFVNVNITKMNTVFFLPKKKKRKKRHLPPISTKKFFISNIKNLTKLYLCLFWTLSNDLIFYWVVCKSKHCNIGENSK